MQRLFIHIIVILLFPIASFAANDPIAVANQAIKAFNNQDMPKLVSLMSNDIVYVSHFGKTYKGKERVATVFKAYLKFNTRSTEISKPSIDQNGLVFWQTRFSDDNWKTKGIDYLILELRINVKDNKVTTIYSKLIPKSSNRLQDSILTIKMKLFELYKYIVDR